MDGADSHAFQALPETGESGVWVTVVGAAADAVEGPAEPLQDGLSLAVGFPAFRAVVGVAVELDPQAAVRALDHQVNAIPADAVLGSHSISTTGDVPEDIPLEVGVEARLRLRDGLDHPFRVLAVTDELAADVVGMQLVQ